VGFGRRALGEKLQSTLEASLGLTVTDSSLVGCAHTLFSGFDNGHINSCLRLIFTSGYNYTEVKALCKEGILRCLFLVIGCSAKHEQLITNNVEINLFAC
jgi:hypothetical protein